MFLRWSLQRDRYPLLFWLDRGNLVLSNGKSRLQILFNTLWWFVEIRSISYIVHKNWLAKILFLNNYASRSVICQSDASLSCENRLCWTRTIESLTFIFRQKTSSRLVNSNSWSRPKWRSVRETKSAFVSIVHGYRRIVCVRSRIER